MFGGALTILLLQFRALPLPHMSTGGTHLGIGMSAPIYADPKVRAARGGAVPNGGLGTVEDIAEAVWYLASDKARYVNGHQLVVDGGVCHSLLRALPRS